VGQPTKHKSDQFFLEVKQVHYIEKLILQQSTRTISPAVPLAGGTMDGWKEGGAHFGIPSSSP